MKKKFLLATSAIILSVFLAEVMLRFLGYSPWKYANSNTSTVFVENEYLGWKAKPGTHLISTNSAKKKIYMTIDKNGYRKSTINKLNNNEQILIIGGSFTQGWGVDDDSTYTAKLQNQFTNYNFYNLGQSGYSGLQSLLYLKDEIKKFSKPKLIVYGFIEHHEYRNVARSSWLKMLLEYSNRGFDKAPKIPFANLDNNKKLKIENPIGYVLFPLREISSVATLLEKFYMKQKSRKRKKNQKIITKLIFSEMNYIAKKNNTQFLVVNLNWINEYTKNEYDVYLSKNKINNVDCNIVLNKEYLVENDFHPNYKAHAHYAKCVSLYLIENNLIIK